MSDSTKDRFTVTEADVRSYVPPSPKILQRALTLTRAWHRPLFFGMENLDPARPALYVGNHTIYGGLDMPMFMNEIHREKDIYIRGLADRGHFMVPGHRDLLKRMGAVVGTRENCSALMNAGAHVLVFPGGAREVNKRKGEAYKLIWKERLGFVRMAVEHGYPIVPFGAVGPEECFDILYDADEFMRSPIGLLLKATGLAEGALRGGEALMPVSRGLGLTMIPKPERFYFGIGEPIQTQHLRGQEDDENVLRSVRDQVRDAVQAQMQAMQEVRRKDPKRGIVSGWLHGQLEKRKQRQTSADAGAAPRRRRPPATVQAATAGVAKATAKRRRSVATSKKAAAL